MKHKIMRGGITCLVIAILMSIISAQEPNNDISFVNHVPQFGEFWAKYFGLLPTEEALSAAIATDGNYLIAGYTKVGSSGGVDGYAMKLSTTGNIIWRTVFGGSLADYGTSIAATADGGCIVAGHGKSFGIGGMDAIAIKLNASGSVVWKRAYGGSTGDDSFYSIVTTPDGGYVAAGDTDSFGAGALDAFVVKLDASGNIVWARTVGGAADDDALTIAQTSDGGYVTAGNTRSAGSGGPDMMVLRFTSIGQGILRRTYGSKGWDRGMSIAQAPDGNYVLTGYTLAFGVGNLDILMLKITPLGSILWKRTFGGPKNEMSLSVAPAPCGFYAIAGYTASFGKGLADILVMLVDSNGTVQRRRTFGSTGDDYSYAIAPTPDNNYLIAASTNSYGGGNFDNFIIKLDAIMELPGCNLSAIPPLTQTIPNALVTIPPLVMTAPSVKTINPSITVTTPIITLGNACP
ncbi:MAG: hypothetical protein A2Y62_11205 [Candidatus Fischerbacteria bacterium RBG_13_37_8]|uniref:Bulb-type lectin domain-containing protein n=1 Tax=Candidatus Fischerbacteria bacterium RBG_13_37_8 TaxID=1817863 RepID=A0A1F5VWJ9_9BACT|nr:MAG: hypothetical protein A2Y62_11205 [Candidatus Fischerbacteria bacterium RBG_13_37_8]